MSQDDNVNTPMVAVVGVIASVVVFVIIVLLQVLFFSMSDAEMVRKDPGLASEPLVDLINTQRADLDSYKWVDQKKGVVGVPITRAMELVLADDRNARVAPPPGAATSPPTMPVAGGAPTVIAKPAPVSAASPVPPATKAEAKKDGH
jgi:hypothetical protein